MLHVVVLGVVEVDAVVGGLALVRAHMGDIVNTQLRGQVVQLLSLGSVEVACWVQDHGRRLGVVDERIILRAVHQREVLGRLLVAEKCQQVSSA